MARHPKGFTLLANFRSRLDATDLVGLIAVSDPPATACCFCGEYWHDETFCHCLLCHHTFESLSAFVTHRRGGYGGCKNMIRMPPLNAINADTITVRGPGHGQGTQRARARS